MLKKTFGSDMFSRKIYRPIADMAAKKIINVSITPNQITFASLIIGIISALFFYFKDNLVGVILFQFSIFLDYLDGSVARIKNIKTSRGAFFDPIADRLREGIVYLSICWQENETILILLYIHIIFSFIYYQLKFILYSYMRGEKIDINIQNNFPHLRYINLGVGKEILLCVGAMYRQWLLPIMLIIVIYDSVVLFGRLYLGYIKLPNTPYTFD